MSDNVREEARRWIYLEIDGLEEECCIDVVVKVFVYLSAGCGGSIEEMKRSEEQRGEECHGQLTGWSRVRYQYCKYLTSMQG